MLNVLDLIELNDLGQPSFIGDQVTLCTNGENVLLELVEVDGNVLDAREDVGEETARGEGGSAL